VVLLFNFFSPSLENVALATILAALSGFSAHYFFWRKLTPDLRINPSYFDRTRLKDLLTMGGWLVINHVGYLLFLQIDLIVVNRLFGPTAGGEYASVLQWSMLLRSMAGVLSGVAQPMFMICYARSQTEDLIRIAKMAVKFMGLGLALPIGLACGFSSELLAVWIGPEFSKLAPLMVLMLIHLTVNLSVTPLFSINVCYNRVKLPGIVTLLMGGLNLILAIWIPLNFDTGFYGVALAGAIVLTLKNAIFTPWYATHVMGLRTRVFFRQMATGIAATLVIFIIGTLLSRMYQITSWTQLIVVGTVISALYAPCVWFCIMAPEERRIFLKMIARQRP
jgi:membrane protein EpsK